MAALRLWKAWELCATRLMIKKKSLRALATALTALTERLKGHATRKGRAK